MVDLPFQLKRRTCGRGEETQEGIPKYVPHESCACNALSSPPPLVEFSRRQCKGQVRRFEIKTTNVTTTPTACIYSYMFLHLHDLSSNSAEED
ncbi:hypothetical protein CRG98_042298 [Punica granatum]|uniref:Uncharacterized protein n=1 Tax=Punica granatum TaxID=22663 RepID=A0A2I0I0D5_PUNGR|nr:hypothetical protein CRG98_042298 [Punica granatum]